MNIFKKKLWVKWNSGDIKKVVIDLPQGLGDQIMCFPLMASLKNYNKDIHITVMTFNKISNNLLIYNKNIDYLKTFKMEFTYRGIIKFFIFHYYKIYSLLRIEDYDLFILIHPNPIRDLLYFLLPAKQKIYNRKSSHKFNEVSRILEYLKIPVIKDYSIDFNFESDLLKKNNLKKNEYILLDIYAQYIEKDPRQWPYFEDLISTLKNNTSKQIVVAGINKSHNEIAGVVDLVNKTNFNELLYLIKNASAVVSMDTFFFHISYCINTPVIALFGPVNPEDRIPSDGKLSYKTIYKNFKCSPCIKNKVRIKCNNNYRCMNNISVDDVMSAIEEYL